MDKAFYVVLKRYSVCLLASSGRAISSHSALAFHLLFDG